MSYLRRGIYPGAIVFVSLLLTAAVFISRPNPDPVPPGSELGDLRAYWSGQIDSLGAGRAYAEFKTYYKKSPQDSHLAAHIMGELLYMRGGSSAISLCDESFSYGCYHALLVKAFADLGESAIPGLVQACATSVPDKQVLCTHGVGHGIAEYYGSDKLIESLRACISIFGVGKDAGCATGVFMDYNAPLSTSASGPSIEKRVLDRQHPYSPCDRVGISESLRPYCYVGLPPYWWSEVGGIDGVAALCAKAPDLYQKACYSGIGTQLPGEVRHDESAIIVACDRLGGAQRADWCLARSAQVQEEFGFGACAIYRKLGTATEHGCTK